MSHYTLTSIDTTGIQNYIFGSNALRENIGASQLVERAIGMWLEDALPKLHNFDNATINDAQRIEDAAVLRAEVIMRGGGNALILFREHGDAVDTIKRLSRRLLCEAPGLEMAVAHLDFDWNQDALGCGDGVINRLAAAVNRCKQQRAPSAAVFSPAVLAECRATRQPAVDLDWANKLVSAEIQAKLSESLQAEAEQRFDDLFTSVISDIYTFERDVEKMTADHDRSHLAVIHADGNGIGQRFIELLKDFSSAGQNRACLVALRDLSQKIANAGEHALCKTLVRLERSFQNKQMERYVSGLKRDERQRIIMPFRPLVFGGDDVTFVCDGRLGLGLAAIFLEEFERAAVDLPYGGAAHACAGVVIFKTHYPFARAYDLCAELCKQTKVALRKAELKGSSGLDWHIAMSGISGEITGIRQREYQLSNGDQLTMRPLSLRAPGIEQPWRNWEAFATLAEAFGAGKSDDELKRISGVLPRSKVKALREALRGGSVNSQAFINTANIQLPEVLGGDEHLQRTGWAGKHCGYFDVIEALDFYLPVDRMEVH